MQANTTETGSLHKNKVHRILAHSYYINFLLFLVGVALDIFWGIKIFSSALFMPLGIALMVLGSILAIWAQAKTRSLKKEDLNKETFSNGPYRYTRHPTHWGLFFLLLGFGL